MGSLPEMSDDLDGEQNWKAYIVANRPGFPWTVQRFDHLSRGPGNRTKIQGIQRLETTLKSLSA